VKKFQTQIDQMGMYSQLCIFAIIYHFSQLLYYF